MPLHRRLRSLQSRQKTLLENIVQINRDKELLAAKIRIHDWMGRCLVATEQYLSREAPPGGRRIEGHLAGCPPGTHPACR